MSDGNARIERYNVLKIFLNCKMSEGSSVAVHMFKMMTFVNQLERLGYPRHNLLFTEIVLNSLAPSYSQFIMIYHMHEMDKSLEELCGMLRTYEFFMKDNVSRPHTVNEGGKKIKKAKRRCMTKAKGKRNV